MDKFDTIIPFGKAKGKTIRQLYKESAANFVATAKLNPTDPEKKKLVLIMRDYLTHINGPSQQTKEPDLFSEEPDLFPNEPITPPNPSNNEYIREMENEGPADPIPKDGQRYINQIWSLKTSNRDKTMFKTLAVDCKLKVKKLDGNTVSPLEVLDSKSRFHLILINKSNTTEIRKAGLNPCHLEYINNMYRALVNLEIQMSLGFHAGLKGKVITLFNQKYMYMSDPKGKRNYETTINYTVGNTNPFYIGIMNNIESGNGEKINLGKDYINITTDDFGCMLSQMNSAVGNFTFEKYHMSLGCALEGGYIDEAKFN